MAALVGLAAGLGRRLWFFSDDWNILAEYQRGGLLEPFNGHLSLLPAGAYQLVARTFGTGSYLPYRLLGLAALVVLGFQLVRAMSERLAWSPVGSWYVALAVSAVMWNPSGVTNVMFPFLMNFSIPIAALLAIWWHLDRGRLRNDVAASLWLAAALATSGLGIMTLGAVVVELVLSRASWRRWLVLSPAPVLWAIWFLSNRGSSAWSTDVAEVLSYAGRMLLGATTSLAAGWELGGVVLAVAMVGVVALGALRWRSLDARALAALAAPTGFALSTALTRLDIVPAIPPDELRYSWSIAAYLVIAAVVLWRPDEWLRSHRPVALGISALAAVVVVIGAVQLVDDMGDWADTVAAARPGLTAVLRATEAIGAERIDPERVLPLSYVPVTAGDYLAAVAAVGSPVGGAPDRVAAENGVNADLLLLEQLDVALRPAEAGCTVPGTVRSVESGVVEFAAGSELRIRDIPADAAEPGLSRFAAQDAAVPLAWPVPPVDLGPEGVSLALPGDVDGGASAALPYRLTLPAGATVELCG
ncbi:MAG: hypothetical protein ACK4V6_05335 [Microthrixaceae bacterium]